jgi:hypothetical protein
VPKKENLLGTPTLVHNSLKLSTERQILIREISKHGIAAKGQALLKKSLQGDRLSASQAIKAKCYDCMGYFEDGKGDCGDPLCPLYPWMAYGQKACANRALPEKKSEALVCSYPPQSGNLQDERL